MNVQEGNIVAQLFLGSQVVDSERFLVSCPGVAGLFSVPYWQSQKSHFSGSGFHTSKWERLRLY